MASKWGNALRILGAFAFGAVLFLLLAGGAKAASAEEVIKKITELQKAINGFDGKLGNHITLIPPNCAAPGWRFDVHIPSLPTANEGDRVVASGERAEL